MEILRYAAFTTDPRGGNPAGLVLDATGMSDDDMLAAARETGFSETVFVTGSRTRYFSPEAEVSFCGHATIALAVAIAERQGPGSLILNTNAGMVRVRTEEVNGVLTATLTSVPPRTAGLDSLEEILYALNWNERDLDPGIPPRAAYAGAWHAIITASRREMLRDLEPDMPFLTSLMKGKLDTINLLWRETRETFHSRNLFPPVGEDPATGAAAAALGGYLRELGNFPDTITIRQGEDMGSPGIITVSIPDEGGITVSGTAVNMDGMHVTREGDRWVMSDGRGKLSFTQAEWDAFTDGVRKGEFDLDEEGNLLPL
jgi:PhzF family phenazine biosynthesis protein